MKMINSIIKNNICILTIEREKALNAMNYETLHELNDALKTSIKDESIRAIIITGSGEKSFIAGADIKIMQNLDKTKAYEFSKLGQNLTNTIENSSKLVIAAVNGFALGGGCEISLACHLRFASENAKFSQPEVKLGLIPGWGGTQRLPKIVGKSFALEMILSGEMIDSKKALSLGLVNGIFSNETLLNEVLLYTDKILKNGPKALESSLLCIQKSINSQQEEGMETEAKLFAKSFQSKETNEGITAFIEKRTPKFD
ncbi:enoyl-CoA hydratase-related protein [Candidatus Marinimicrobia bacterium]|nr:enoyl-CoA hydratase-related protein [Candidatus Neomarinimicrobiota bacterium]MDC0383988.1 enoyl-CoA hydratase-related protein [Candidatus Neomarinimicrobiota bacterium]